MTFLQILPSLSRSFSDGRGLPNFQHELKKIKLIVFTMHTIDLMYVIFYQYKDSTLHVYSRIVVSFYQIFMNANRSPTTLLISLFATLILAILDTSAIRCKV